MPLLPSRRHAAGEVAVSRAPEVRRGRDSERMRYVPIDPRQISLALHTYVTAIDFIHRLLLCFPRFISGIKTW